jgi:hypothetical protein
MKKHEGQQNIIKQRITLVMVMFFCMLVSGVEYFPQPDLDQATKKEAQTDKEGANQNQTFLDVAVDAVVPFVTSVAQSTFYIIYEIFDFERITTFKSSFQLLSNLEFREILFERIISTNAP